MGCECEILENKLTSQIMRIKIYLYESDFVCILWNHFVLFHLNHNILWPVKIVLVCFKNEIGHQMNYTCCLLTSLVHSSICHKSVSISLLTRQSLYIRQQILWYDIFVEQMNFPGCIHFDIYPNPKASNRLVITELDHYYEKLYYCTIRALMVIRSEDFFLINQMTKKVINNILDWQFLDNSTVSTDEPRCPGQDLNLEPMQKKMHCHIH